SSLNAICNHAGYSKLSIWFRQFSQACMPATNGSSVEPKSAAHLKQMVGSLPRRTSSVPFAFWISTTFLSAHRVQSPPPLTINVVPADPISGQSRPWRDCIGGRCHNGKIPAKEQKHRFEDDA